MISLYGIYQFATTIIAVTEICRLIELIGSVLSGG